MIRARYFAAPLLALSVFIFAPEALAATRSLSLRMSGSDVTALQNQLIAKGYLASGKNTGYFGNLTQAAVEKFQCDKKIICASDAVSGYGIAGPKTQAALASAATAIPAGTQNPSAVTGKSLTGPYTGPLEFSGWVPDWRAASGTLDTAPHLSQLKSVMPFGYTVSDTGTLIDSAHISEDPWPAFIAAAKAQGTRVVPTVEWGDGEAIQNVLSNSTTRIALEDSIANLVKQNDFDGIDIDFEAKESQTIDYFSTFLKGLYSRMGNKWVYCTVEARMPLEDRYSPGATIPPDATDYANDYNALNKYCDRVELMAYDQGTVDVRLNNARSAPYAPVADPGWVETMVLLASQSIAKNKIIIGVPTYGYEYQVTPLATGGYQYERLWAFNPNYALQIAAQLGITPTRTSADEMGFTYNPSSLQTVAPQGSQTTETQQQTTPATTVANNQGSQLNSTQPFNYVTWSDAQAIADKVSIARQMGVRGIAVFSLGGAEDQNMWSVLK
ncbi:MAG TPA: glycosyl hydrolase family 18 protein [Candidatus Paceibacterota bacterium]|nr:glycosyl hydrolase family 18 protein [Candidatus Paceibacterota bacterium]